MKELVVFDLDGTIISKQSQFVLIRYLFKKKSINFGFYFVILLWFMLYKIGLAKNPRPMMEWSFSFLNGKSVEEFDVIIEDFFQKEIKKFIFPQIIDIISKHRAQNREVVIISNAIDPIVKKAASYLGINKYISTKLEVINGKFTGKIDGDIIYGNKKVATLREFTQENGLNFANSYAYTDHISDLSLLLAVTNPCAINPDKSLRKEAKKRRWPILNFKI